MTNNYIEFPSDFWNNEFNKFFDNSSFDQLKNPFDISLLNNNQENQEKLDEDYMKIYFIEMPKSTDSNTGRSTIKFNITKEENSNSNGSNNLIGNKKGRKKISEKEITKESTKKNKKPPHDKFDVFNILNLIQVDSINCIILFLNCVLNHFNYDKEDRFKNIISSAKKEVNKTKLAIIKNKKLHEIITVKISSKYKNFKYDYNQKLYEKIKQNPEYKMNKVIISILDEKYLNFFQNVYYQSKRTFNLQKYGIDANIPLSNVKMYIDKVNKFNDKEYKNTISNCINENYFDGKLMFYLEK